MILSEFMKTALMTHLQERVASLGVCPVCHAKTLALKNEGTGMKFHQCRQCLTVWVLDNHPHIGHSDGETPQVIDSGRGGEI